MGLKTRGNALFRLRARLRKTDLAALRLYTRLVPSESQRIFILTVLIGAVCGLVAVAFHLSIRFAEARLIDRAMAAQGHSWMFWTILTPTLGGLLSGILLQYVVPDARGSGIPQVKVAYAIKDGRLSFLHSTIGKFAVATVQLGSGASMGREGPTVQICAGIASLFGRAAALSRKNLRRLLPVGAAAGIAAAFNAPISAVTFTIEEVVGDLDHTVLSGVVVASALAAVIERGVLGEHPVFDVPPGFGLHHGSSLIPYALLGLAAGLVSLLFTELLLKLRSFFQQLHSVPAWARPSIGGIVTGALAVAAMHWFHTGGITGAGYEILSEALTGSLALKALLAFGVMKILSTSFSYSSGGAGGIFAPTLLIGATIGGIMGHLDVAIFHHDQVELGAFALVGMGAAFAGVIRAPITSVLIVFELTGSYSLILPLMIANTIAYAVARHIRPVQIYEAFLEQDGVHLPHPKAALSHALERLYVADAMTPEPFCLEAGLTVAKALDRIKEKNFSVYPVVANGRKFLGFVTESRLRRLLAEDRAGTRIETIAANAPQIFADQKLIKAAVKMNELKIRHLPVVDRSPEKQLVGLLAMSDLVKAQACVAVENGNIERTQTPELNEVEGVLNEKISGI